MKYTHINQNTIHMGKLYFYTFWFTQFIHKFMLLTNNKECQGSRTSTRNSVISITAIQYATLNHRP